MRRRADAKAAGRRQSHRSCELMTAIKVPPLGESIVEATVSRWLKKEGEAVAAGDTLVELDTDKITVEVPALAAGVLSKQSAKEGAVVNVGDVLGDLAEGASAGAAAPAQSAPASVAPASSAPAAGPKAPAQQAAQTASTGTAKVSPAAQRVAAEQNVDLSSVTGTGRGGVVSKPDVIEQGSRAPATAPSTPSPAPA